MLQARIGRFESGARRALLAASVLGQTFWLGGVAEILGRGAAKHEVEHWLSVLVQHEVIEPHAVSQLANQKELSFRHILVCEAAYALLGENDRATGHRLAGEFLEAAGETNPILLAEHLERGGERTRAALFYARGAQSALEHYASRDALLWSEKGMACVSDGEPFWQLRAIESAACTFLGHMGRAFQTGMIALPKLPPGSQLWCHTMGAIVLSAAFGNPETKKHLPELTENLLRTEPEPGAEAVYAATMAYLTGIASTTAPIPKVRVISDRLREVSKRVASGNPAIMRFYGWGHGHFEHHRIPTPWTILQEAETTAQLCRQAGDLRMLSFILLPEVALTWGELGSLERAFCAIEEGSQAARQTQDALGSCLASVYLEHLRIETEDLADVPASLAAAQEAMRIMGSAALIAVSSWDVQARGYLRLGRVLEAEAAAREAARVGQMVPAYEPMWRASLMRILLAKGAVSDGMSGSRERIARHSES